MPDAPAEPEGKASNFMISVTFLSPDKLYFIFNSKIEQRFKRPITSLACEKFEKSWVSDASRRKWALVLKVFDQWKEERNKAVLKECYSGEPVISTRN